MPCLTQLRKVADRLRANGFRVSRRSGDLKRLESLTEGDSKLGWLLEWQILATCEQIPAVHDSTVRLLVAGGAHPLLAFYLATLGHEVHTVDFLERSKSLGLARIAAKQLDLPKASFYATNLTKLEFEDQHFDHALSPGAFHQLDYPAKQHALAEIARCLKPSGLLSMTFEYRNPAPYIMGHGEDTRLRNRLSTPEDIQRSFLETDHFEPSGNSEFYENEESPVSHRSLRGVDYTLGVLLLRKRTGPGSCCVVPSVAGPALASDGKRTAEPDSTAVKTPFLSVIICTYKRPALLRGALRSMLEQELRTDLFEVIVVDNNSEDETESVVREFMEKAPNIRYALETKQGLSHSRNRGCEEARGTHVIYMDDDAKAHPTYLAKIRKTIIVHDPDIMGGPIYPYYTGEKPGWFKDEYEIRRHADETGWSTTCSVSGSSFVIKKDLLCSLGMFDPSLGMVGETVRLGEERAVLNRYRQRPVEEQKVFYHVGCIVYHHVPRDKMTPKYLLKRYYVAGHAKAQIQRMTCRRWGPVSRAWYILRCWLRRFAGPFSHLNNKKSRRRVKQWILERGMTFTFEVGRLVGCLPRWKRQS